MYLINYEKVSPNISRKVKIKFWQFLKSDTKLFVQRKLHLQGGALWPELAPCPSYSNIYLSELGSIPGITKHSRTMTTDQTQTPDRLVSSDHGIGLIIMLWLSILYCRDSQWLNNIIRTSRRDLIENPESPKKDLCKRDLSQVDED